MDGTRMRSRVGSILLILALLLPVGAVAADQDDALAIPRDGKGLPLWEIVQWQDAPVRLTLPDHAALDQLLATVPIASFNREQIDVVYTSPKSYHLVFEPRVTSEEAQRLTAAGYDFENVPDVDRAGREETEAKPGGPLWRRPARLLIRIPGESIRPSPRSESSWPSWKQTTRIFVVRSPGARRSRDVTWTASSFPTT